MNKHLPLLDNIIKFVSLFLLLFIPLYPKIPLLDISSTWVYIRLEDVLVAIVVGFYITRRRLPKDNPLTKPIIIYWVVGFVSSLISITILGRTIWHYFPHLVILHFLRRIEYMIVFFVAASTISKARDVAFYIGALTVTTMLVNVYGYAQKYLQYPAFLTMNEEFAKGEPLILHETSRIASTFAGHYDLAAYLVFAIVLFASLIIGLRNIFVRAALILANLASGIVLLWTQSRSSFLALGCALLCVIWWHKKKVLFIPIVVIGIVALPFVLRSSDRYAKTLQYRRVLYDARAGNPVGVAQMESDGRVVIEESASPGVDSLPIGSGFIRIPLEPPIPIIASYAVTALRSREDYPAEGIPTVGEEAQMALERNELRFSTVGPVATTSGEVEVVPNRFYLDRAIAYDISITTRFQGTWPRAWEAFSRNIFTGSGYSVLNLASDNDYLRALGETGILGSFTFFFIFFAYFVFVKKAVVDASSLVASTAFGVGGGIVSLLVAAFFVDIFEASKMAYTLWIMMGVSIGGLLLTYKKPFPYRTEIAKIVTSPILLVGLITALGVVLFGSSQKITFLGDDFTWLRWATSTYLSDIPRFFTDSSGFFYRPLSKVYFAAAYALFWFKPGGYHLVNVLLHVASTVLVYLLVRKTVGKNVVAIFSSLLFLIMAIHHENVLWISGMSSVAGATSAFVSIYLFLRFLEHNSLWRYLTLCFSFFFMAVSLLWYEGMLGMPLVIVVSAVLFGKKREWGLSIFFLLLIPLYWWLRSAANAVAPAGNYAINLMALPFNSIGNSMGYIAMSLFGPNAATFFWNLRELVKANPIAGIVLVFPFILILSRIRKFALDKSVWFWISVFIFSLIPHLGLGNIAERYGYIASSAVATIAVIVLGRFKKIVAITIFFLLLWLNWRELRVVESQWEEASVIAQNVLETPRKLYFPLGDRTNLVFVGVPERVGRAWVFPVGLSDALYHMFNDDRLRVYTTGTKNEGIRLKKDLSGVTHIVVFDKNYEIAEIFE